MIVVVCNDKKTKYRINNDVLNEIGLFLLYNPEQWFKSDDISKYCGCSNVRAYINKLRNEGLPIISSIDGYKLTENKDEIIKCYNELRERALRTITAAKQMKKYL